MRPKKEGETIGKLKYSRDGLISMLKELHEKFMKLSLWKKYIIIYIFIFVGIYVFIVLSNIFCPQICLNDKSNQFERCSFLGHLESVFIGWPDEIFFFESLKFIFIPYRAFSEFIIGPTYHPWHYYFAGLFVGLTYLSIPISLLILLTKSSIRKIIKRK